jgi:hypothetical protein
MNPGGGCSDRCEPCSSYHRYRSRIKSEARGVHKCNKKNGLHASWRFGHQTSMRFFDVGDYARVGDDGVEPIHVECLCDGLMPVSKDCVG